MIFNTIRQQKPLSTALKIANKLIAYKLENIYENYPPMFLKRKYGNNRRPHRKLRSFEEKSPQDFLNSK